jgi:soluble lytic murein transglycosylase
MPTNTPKPPGICRGIDALLAFNMMRRAQLVALTLALACAGDSASAKDGAKRSLPAAAVPAARPGPSGGASSAPAPDARLAAAAATPPLVAPAPTPLPPGTAALAPDAVAPYFAPDSLAGKAQAALALDDWRTAHAGFTAALAAADAPKGGPERARLQFLLARTDAELGNWAAAAAGFDAAAPELSLLADTIAYDAARAWFRAGDREKAATRAQQVHKGALREADARLLLADVVQERGKAKDTAQVYEQYLADFPKGPRLAEARFRLAEAKEALGKAIPDALTLYRQITIDASLTPWAPKAKTRVDALVKTLPKKKRAAWTTLTAAEHMTKGKDLFDDMQNPESEAEYHAARSAPGITPELLCEALYYEAQSVWKRRQRARAAKIFDEAIDACAKVDNPDLQMKSAYQGGRSYSYAADDDSIRASIDRFARAEKWHPEHSFADDARLRQAEGWARLRSSAEHDDKVTELLSKLPELYPNGDMRGEALWRLAWRDYRAKRYEETIRWLDQAIATIPRDYNWWGEGQPYYWKGRALVQLGKAGEALDTWKAGVRKYPLSYYSLLALNRIRETWPKEFEALVGELKQPPLSWTPGTASFVFKPRAVFAEPGFMRAVELLKLGLGAEAQQELARLNMKGPGDRKQVTDADQVELLWATALLYDRAGRYDLSHWIARWSVLDYKDTWPGPHNRARWEIAYPKAWWHLLDPAAKSQSYPTELLVAHVREESAFTPTLESWANAVGLTQMIKSTAERFGKGLGFEINRENLRDPEKNVAVGSRFLGFLWNKFEQRVQLTVPAYNAGEGAVWRWLCDRGTWPADEFAESIPHDEARNYSKRVINSYFVYSWLRDGTVPPMPNDIPPNVINGKKCKAN